MAMCICYEEKPENTDGIDTIGANQTIRDGETLVSAGGSFELGFFSPGSGRSRNRYLGIWYKDTATGTVVWVANRDFPLNDTSGLLKLTDQGILVLLNPTEGVVWSSNSSRFTSSPLAQLLESGNLVVNDGNGNNTESFLWQSFDYPSDTLLPGMKFGMNIMTGLDWYLSSWKSGDDPARGDFTYGLDPGGYPQFIIKNGAVEKMRFGPWNGLRFSGVPNLKQNSIFTFEFVFNQVEIYYRYEQINSSVVTRLVLNPNGVIQRFVWINRTHGWIAYTTPQTDNCDFYALCGAFGNCNIDSSTMCQCLQGFEPKYPREWDVADWSNGCIRRTQLGCGVSDGFLQYSNVKLPDTRYCWFNESMTLDECRIGCLKNCSCRAYANMDIRGGGSGCFLWFGDLIDIRTYSTNGQDVYVKVAASELGRIGAKKLRWRTIAISLALLAGVLLTGLSLTIYLWKKKQQQHQISEVSMRRSFNEGCTNESQKQDLELQQFDFATITHATDNFSINNKLGEGGFGLVFKGVLEDRQEIAVKTLSKNSKQGVDEFKNEVIYIARLQHRNLVKLLGYCFRGEEKMLIYEYMPNKSLDLFIFDQTQRLLLDKPKRLNIINGIARGLLYLHQDSRLRIIHRDLKASNILLDNEMNPKISDFGTARHFGGNESKANTSRVVGTYGYMSPEYAIDGIFSVKSDVYSFGVLVLEIVSGKRNRGFSHPEHHLNLLGDAWKLCIEGKSRELVDPSVEDLENLSELVRAIHVGLLCVQQYPEDRPNMSTVVLMLGGEGVPSHHKRLRRRETSFLKKKKIEKVEFVIEPTTHESENQLEVKPESNIDNEEAKQEQLKQAPELYKARGKKKIDGRKTRTEQIHDNETKYVYRSNIQSLIKFFKTTKLREEHLTLLRKTHFSLLVDTLSGNKVKRRYSIKYDDVVAKNLQTYQMDGTTFEIAGKKLKLKRNDFKLIFGIACGQKKMNLAYGRKNEIVMVQRRKITESRMTNASIQKLITKLLRSNNNEDVEDVVRLVCLLVCLLLLYPGTGTTIGWGLMKYLENIDEMKPYDWCGAAKQHLTRSIARNINQIDSVCGCVIILLIIKPNDNNQIPRFAKWNITHLGEQLAKSSLHDLKHIEESNLKDTIEEQNIYKQLQPQTDDENEDEECNFEKQEQTELFENEEEPIIRKIFSLSPGRNSPNPKHQIGARKKRKSITLQSKKNAKRKANFQHETEEGLVHLQRNELSFDKLENDEEETMIKHKVGPTTSPGFKHQTPRQEEQITVEVEATTPKTSPLVSSMIKRVKNRETRKEHKDLDFWYITKRQPKQNKAVDEVEPMVEESAKTRKEEQTQHQHPTKQIDTSYPMFHKLPKKSRMKLTSLWATKTSSYPILQGNEVGSYLYLDDIDKIVKCEELSGNAINAYKEILMIEEQPKPKFSLSSQAGTTYIFTTSCHRKRQGKQKRESRDSSPVFLILHRQRIPSTLRRNNEHNSGDLNTKSTDSNKNFEETCLNVTSSHKRLSRPETRSYTAKRQKRENEDNNETKKQQDNKEETARTKTTSKQQERNKTQRQQKHEPSNEPEKQAEAKERIRKQQQCIKVMLCCELSHDIIYARKKIFNCKSTKARRERQQRDKKATRQEKGNRKNRNNKQTTRKEEKTKKQKHEPANEAKKQAEEKERIRKQQQCIKDVVSSLMTLSMPERRSLTAKTQKQEEKDNKEIKKQQDNKKKTATRETTSKQQERKKRQRQQKDEPANQAQKQGEQKERITKHQQQKQAKTRTKPQQNKQEPKQHKPKGKKKIKGRKTRSDQIHDREAKYVYRSNMLSLIRFFNATKLENEHFQILKRLPSSF
ncbi:unnamed protein product [Camellia sinensis]